MLMSNGCKPDKQGFVLACERCNVMIVKHMIQHGADPAWASTVKLTDQVAREIEIALEQQYGPPTWEAWT